MNWEQVHRVYFIGIGGIGMSALARYFKHKGIPVAGYDLVSSTLTRALEEEGMEIHYTDDVSAIPTAYKQKENTLVVYTPAIPHEHSEYRFFLAGGFEVHKRSQVLGMVTQSSTALAVAGTHGKTTTSSLLAHLLSQSTVGCTAFVGGIMKAEQSNYMLHETSPIVVVEADEYDRSFLALRPAASVITSVDPDHLDIYEDGNHMIEAFKSYADQVEGKLAVRYGVERKLGLTDVLTYSADEEDEAQVKAVNHRIDQGSFCFDVVAPWGNMNNVSITLPGKHNIENALGAYILAHEHGVTDEEFVAAMRTFGGISRRFEFKARSEAFTFIDDYAHHPQELEVAIETARSLYPTKEITGIFQPHLYSRTSDFHVGFAASLSMLDEVILLDIYPAREEPMPGVTSELIYDLLQIKRKRLLKKTELMAYMAERTRPEVLMTLGAGDIGTYVEPLKTLYSEA